MFAPRECRDGKGLLLNDPKDAVRIGAQFNQLPDGTNHVDTMQMNGVSKHLLVTTKNSNYQKMM